MNNPKCKACGWTLANVGAARTCPQCDAEIPCEPEPRPHSCPRYEIVLGAISDNLDEHHKRISRLEARFAPAPEPVTGHDPLCSRCVSILKDRMGIRDPLARSAEHWWASELAKLSQCQSWSELRAGIVTASNKVLNLTKLMEEEERL